MAVIDGSGNIIATGSAGAPIYGGPNAYPFSLIGISGGYVANPGPTPNLPPPSPGLTPGGVGTDPENNLSGGAPGTGTTGCSASTCSTCCLTADERVMMFGGGCKAAAEVSVGDRLLTIDWAGNESCDTVTVVMSMDQPVLRIVHERGNLCCSTSHRLVLMDRRDVPATDLEPGDLLVGDDGKAVAILEVLQLGAAPVYGWTCEPSHTYIASGILNHNKISQQKRSTQGLS